MKQMIKDWVLALGFLALVFWCFRWDQALILTFVLLMGGSMAQRLNQLELAIKAAKKQAYWPLPRQGHGDGPH